MSEQKIKVSAVSYLNTIPIVHGIESSPTLLDLIELSRDIPSECARKLLNGEVDLGLIPVAVLPQLSESHIISDYCIGASGKVDSVLLFSEVPLEEIRSIQLDYQSRTSVQLCRILCKHYWSISPDFRQAEAGFEEHIKGDEAALVIGDRCFGLKEKVPYQYDLSEAWYQWKGLPFVFACWVSNRELSSDFQKAFNLALSRGVGDLQGAIDKFPFPSLTKAEQLMYLKNAIDYRLDEAKLEALDEFLKLISA